MALDPARVERNTALVAECRPLLDGGAGMDAVQRLLKDRGVGVMDSIIVTRELLGAGPSALGKAKEIVLSSPSRTTERRHHEELVDALLNDEDQLAADG